MILVQNQAANVTVRLDAGSTFGSCACIRADGGTSGAPPTTSEPVSGFRVAALTPTDTAQIGQIAVCVNNGTGQPIGVWWGVVLPDYPSTGDPWATPIPGAYGMGSAGNVLGSALFTDLALKLPTTSYTAPNNSQIVANGSSLANIISGLTSGTYVVQLTTAQFDALVAATWQTVNQIETGFTAQQAMRLILSALAGKVAISGSTVTIRNINDTITRITATTDAAGQRTAVTTNVS